MKKLLFALLISITLLSCEKNQDCYHCTFGAGMGGVNRPDEDYCGEPGRRFYDAQGNPEAYNCVLKD